MRFHIREAYRYRSSSLRTRDVAGRHSAAAERPSCWRTSARKEIGDVKAVIEQMAIVGYKELNESGEFVIPGFVKMSVVNRPATEARSGVNPFTKEPMEFAAKPASKSVKASPLKVAKDAV
jgi:DNA-binding protein HU-beta